ncbi:MAG: hypothetical protein ACI9U2_001411 [Bradymonadia bacterium]|jgi:hypothetical protein
MPRLRAPAQAASKPTLLDFRMPEQMLAEISRTRTPRKPRSDGSEADSASAAPPIRSALGSNAPRPSPIAALDLGGNARTSASTPPPPRNLLGDIARALRAEDPPKEASLAETGELVSLLPRAAFVAGRPKGNAARSAAAPLGMGTAPKASDPFKAVEPPKAGDPFEAVEPTKASGPVEALEPPKASDSFDAVEPLKASEPVDAVEPPWARDPVEAVEPPKTIDEVALDADAVLHLDPPTIDPGEMLPEYPSIAPAPLLPAQGEVHLLTQRRATTKPPPGLYVDPPMEELPFFESSDAFSERPAPVASELDDDPDLPFVLGPELEVQPVGLGANLPGESVDLLPPDGSVDFEFEALQPPGETLQGIPVAARVATAVVAPDDEFEEFAGVIVPVDAKASAVDVHPDGDEPLDEADVDLVIEDVDDDGLLDSGDMEAIILTTQAAQSAVRAAPPPMPAAASARFVLRPLSESLDDSLVVGVGDDPIDIGRLVGDICFQSDAYLSPLHARFEIVDDTLQVTDLDSANGVWLRVRGEAEIAAGGVFLCGQQIIRLDVREKTPTAGPVDGTARMGAASSGTGLALVVLDVDGQVATRYRVPVGGCRLGRQLADVVFTDDAFMSSTHALIQPRGYSALLRDLDSRNGVWLRLDGPRDLKIGDAVMFGRTVLRVGQPSG